MRGLSTLRLLSSSFFVFCIQDPLKKSHKGSTKEPMGKLLRPSPPTLNRAPKPDGPNDSESDWAGSVLPFLDTQWSNGRALSFSASFLLGLSSNLTKRRVQNGSADYIPEMRQVPGQNRGLPRGSIRTTSLLWFRKARSTIVLGGSWVGIGGVIRPVI